jgi:2-amino-4-hydroxy-6-hydroxymethyldihydropteridine diphosphokinase
VPDDATRPDRLRRAFVGLGSNLGDRALHLVRARRALAARPDVVVVGASRIYESAAVGGPPQGPYLNAALAIDTSLEPRSLLRVLLEVEAGEGRVRDGGRDAPRTLDLDLLLYEDRIVTEPDLQVPHPRLHERAFALVPLAELAPERMHPLCGESLAALSARRAAPQLVWPWRPGSEGEEESWRSWQ